MHNPSVEILLATYNGGLFISEQLESLAQQTYNNWRLIVRDDGSSDLTLEQVAVFAKQYPGKVEIICDQKGSLKAVGNFAELLQQSSADYIMFCDQDDVWMPTKIEHSLRRMLELEEVNSRDTPILVHTDLRVVNIELEVLANSFWQYQHIIPEFGQHWTRLLLQNVVTGCTVMLNKALRDIALPIPQQAIMHDWWLALVAAIFGTVGDVRRQTVLYRQHGMNDTGAKSWNLGYILNRILQGEEVRASLSRTKAQAGVLAQQYAEKLSLENLEVIQQFSALDSLGFFERRAFLLRHGILKIGFIRNVGLLANV
ncbi:MAG: glycosyltransferase family 2 protein [Thermaceae bacterium]|nr:glycosyltransferase family 2 protein [Thermaceae bacterium]